MGAFPARQPSPLRDTSSMQFTPSSSLPVLLLASTAAAFLLPGPAGKYNVALTTGPLIDYARNDPYAAAPTPRALMVSVFQPTTCASTVSVPYMPSTTAEYQGPFLQANYNVSGLSPVFLAARLPVCAAPSGSCPPPKAPGRGQEGGPILLLSPGWGGPRLYYSAVASAIASEGFTVIAIDHPGDANIVTYPDGHAAYLNASTGSDLAMAEHTRATDASFVVDQLSNATAMGELLPQRGPRPFPTDRIGMLGHSLGGSSAIMAASQDRRIRAAINWDGFIQGSLPPSGLSQPVLLMMNAGIPNPESWTKAWPLFKGPKLWLKIANITHQTFTDIPTLLQAAGQDIQARPDLLGTIEPAQMLRILAAYTTAWMNSIFAGKVGGPLLQGQEKDRFPEVSTVERGNF